VIEMADAIVGKFFHSFEPEGTYINPPTRIVKWQGQIRSKVKDGIYLVQLHDWIIGAAGDQILVPIEQMMDWKFYDDPADWRHWYEKIYEPRIKGFKFEKAGAR
jgi:hypothetical protein